MERIREVAILLAELGGAFGALCRSRTALVAENLFLRKQLAMYQERGVRPRRATAGERLAFTIVSRCFDWSRALTIVRPRTFIRWHRNAFRAFWRGKSRPGRPQIPRELQTLIRRMSRENHTWGQERIANELLVKLGIQISPRTVAKYLPKGCHGPRGDQTWSTFVRNHARGLLACDFCMVATAGFQLLYVFIVFEVGTRRIAHINVTKHPTAAWTLQQFREVLGPTHRYFGVIHDRDNIFSADLDNSLAHCGLRVFKTPYRSPKANAYCERVIGTLRRECLDFFIPLNAQHLKLHLRDWVTHYNGGRPHMSLGPDVPNSVRSTPPRPVLHDAIGCGVIVARPVLGGLHHEYALEAA